MRSSSLLFRFEYPVYFVLLVLLALGLTGSADAVETAASPWAFADRDYRLLLSVDANGFARTEKVVRFEVDFGAALTKRGATGSFDEESVRIAEVDSRGIILNDSVAFQFDNGVVENDPQGIVFILLDGTTAANQKRFFQIYFDTTGVFTQSSSPDYVLLESDAQWHRGQQSFWIKTFDGDGVTVNTQYYYHKRGGGFASIYDRDGEDWISYYPDTGSESRGEFRGIPNMGTAFHPGYNNVSGSNLRSNSKILSDGPLRLVIQSTSVDGEWQVKWEIFPTYAQMTVLDIPNNGKYWFLYEGTPGGNLEYSGAPQDVVVRSDGQPNINAGQQWAETNQELGSSSEAGGEWVYFADSATDRLFFVAHSEDDDHPDSYRHQYDDGAAVPSGTDDNGAMTVMGFGRKTTTGIMRYLTALDATFTIGFGESQTSADATGTIYNATEDVAVWVENQAPHVQTNSPLVVNEGDTAVYSNSHLSGKDDDGDIVLYEMAAVPANGTLFLNDTPLGVGQTFSQTDIDSAAVSYTHDGSETSSDSFMLIPQDGAIAIDAITVTLIVNGTNDAPVANADNVYAVSGRSVVINVLANDTDAEGNALSVFELTDPAHGTVLLNPDQTVTYQADKYYMGSDSFSYKISDGEKESSAALVNLTVGEQLYIFLPAVRR